ncbi:SMR domain-containing protein At5g58720 isoform X1 [Ziziphus jujuba]|uniref:SMR domain-containing protein At5g58720 isoform X1 n=1 Tax=Ziziphus jujuba TaxID=326968 RepID=A0A6P3Z7K3_ZIZJJ|nr:SMR domain-containing protein At5g58720 isoform X1 [Ziziphus jujuba]
MKHNAARKKKKKSSKPPPPPPPAPPQPPSKQVQVQKGDDEEQKLVVKALTGAFSSASLDDSISAYRQAHGDPDRAAMILDRALLDNADDPSTSSSSSSSSSSGVSSCSGFGSSSDGFVESGCIQNLVNERRFKGSSNNQKKVIAATGTVSTVLGKEYVMSTPRKVSKMKGLGNGIAAREEVEQFLCSMLGDDSGLSFAVVRDVLCQCGYDVEKALNVLLDLSSSPYEQSASGSNDSLSHKEDTTDPLDYSDILTDRASDCTSHSSECELQDNIWSVGCNCRNYAKALASADARPTSASSNASNLSQKVLESLFNIPKSPEYEPSTMDWRNVAKKLQSLGPQFDVYPSSNADQQQDVYAKGDEYHAFRKNATQHWDSVRSCYQKAATAHSKGSREYAAYLSDQGRAHKKLAREADEQASKDIFIARNKGIENVITIDLHGQHVKQAMGLLKMHLLFVSYVQTVQILRVITGCGTHGVGKSKLKQSVIKLLEKEGIGWSEENRGVVLVKLDGKKEFSFLNAESDSE